MTEDEEWLELEKYCEANEQKLLDAGERRMAYCKDCIGCKYYEDVGKTFADLEEPIIHGICHHPDGRQDKSNCKGREELT